MKSRITPGFRKAFAALPDSIKAQAREAYRQFQQNPSHPGLRFKPVHPSLPIYSARVGKGYRAVGQMDQQGVVWFWIGSHAEYDKLLTRLR